MTQLAISISSHNDLTLSTNEKAARLHTVRPLTVASSPYLRTGDGTLFLPDGFDLIDEPLAAAKFFGDE